MELTALAKFAVIDPFLRKEMSLSAIAKANGTSLRTLQRWVVQYNKEGLQGLDRKARADKGRYRKTSVELKELAEGLALQKQALTIASMTRKLDEYCSEKNIDPVNYYTVRKIVKRIPNNLNTLAKYGDKAYENLYEVIMRRESKYPNEIWQVDHSLLSVKVLLEDGQIDFPWLTIIIDDCSRMIMAFSLFVGAPSAIQTALTLRNAIWYKQKKDWPACGIP
jgi:putative transposase